MTLSLTADASNPFADELTPESPRIHISRSGQWQGQRSFWMPQTAVNTAIDMLVGKWSIIGGQPVLLNQPATFPGIDILVADEIETRGIGKVTNAGSATRDVVNIYEAIQMDVTYRPLPQGSASNNHPPNTPTVPTGTYLEFTSDVAVDAVALPGKYVFWKDNSKQIDPGPNAPTDHAAVRVEEFNLTWSHVPYPPWSVITSLGNNANATAFAGAAAGCLLFLGAQRRYSFEQTQNLWTLTYKFKYRSIPWNKKYRFDSTQGTVGWYDIKDGAGNDIVPTGDFNTLFQFLG